jgi:phosphopentomutase
MIAYSPSFAGGGEIPERDTFAALGATIAENFGVAMPENTIGEPIEELL